MAEIIAVISRGADKEKLNLALRKGLEKAMEYDATLMLLVPAMKHVSGTILSKLISESLLEKLKKREECKLNNITIRMESLRTYSPFNHECIVVALWGGAKMLAKLDATLKVNRSKVVIAISWLPEELESWVKSNGAVILSS